MATLLDFGLNSFFSVLFSWLLVFVLMFAILEKSKTVSSKAGINALIAFSISVLFLFVPGVSKILTLSSPWFVLMIFFIFVVLMMMMFLGATEADVKSALGSQGIGWWIVIISILILVAAVSQVYKPQITEIEKGVEAGQVSSPSFITSVGLIILNPKVLGLALIIIIAALAVGKLAAYNK